MTRHDWQTKPCQIVCTKDEHTENIIQNIIFVSQCSRCKSFTGKTDNINIHLTDNTDPDGDCDLQIVKQTHET
jgi:hypothetical protein